MRAFINISEDPIVGIAQAGGMLLLLLLFLLLLSTSNTSEVNTDDKITRLVDTKTTLMEKVDSNQEYRKKKINLQYQA